MIRRTLNAGFRKLLLVAAVAFVAAPALLVSNTAHAQGQTNVDSDGDGVTDDVDVEPCNARVSARVFVPADRTYGMMMFEDMWPSRGDFDFNDAVIAYNQVLRYDSSAQLTGLRLELSVLAVGGGNTNGLALRLPGTPRSSVTSLAYSVGNVLEPAALGRLDPNATDATVVISDNLHALFGVQATREFVNTDPNLPLRAYVDIVVDISLDPGHGLAAADAPYDLFLFNRYAGTEIHRPRYRGTQAMNAAHYNTADDGSTLTRSFVTTGGIPFALEFPELTSYPQELAPIDLLYPGIVQFGASGGTQSQDFYRHASGGTAFGLTPPRELTAQAAADTSCFAPDPGVCGSATGTGSVEAPATALCSFGTASSVTTSGGLWRWTCAGNYSDPTACTTPDWVCEPNLSSSCAITGGTGTQTCNGSGTGYGACTATSCNTGYYLSGDSCVAQVCSPGSTQSCPVTNGTGEQTCDNLGSAWSACTAVTCNAGYVRNGNVCEPAPSCTDFIRNGNETDVDCGGSCGKCATGEACATGTDCASATCSGGVCVNSCSNQAPVTAGLPGCVNISAGRPASAVSSYGGAVPVYANDDDRCTAWNSGGYAARWWQVDLGSVRSVRGVGVVPNMLPNGNVTHVFEVSTDGVNWTSALTVSQYMASGSDYWLDFGANFTARYVRVTTTSSPSWVAWFEVQAFACP